MSTSPIDLRASHATVAIVTALPIEYSAMNAMVDDPAPYSTRGNAPGEYVLGRVPSKEGGHHEIVIALCSPGQNLAAAATAILLERFPNVESVVMVGIAGAAPDPGDAEWDVRLGDIVVSNADGVVQYDYDKETNRDGAVQTEHRHPPRPSSARLHQASLELQSLAREHKRPWEPHVLRAAQLQGSARPTVLDELHDATTPETVMVRTVREDPDRPEVFHGRIASGNKLLKNPQLRERLRKTLKVKAIEMEASGVSDATWLNRAGYFVVRGTCDYCDDYKSDTWQPYAAVVAAAYTRALLEQMRSAAAPSNAHASDAVSLLPDGLRKGLEAGSGDKRALDAARHALNELLDSDRDESSATPTGEPQLKSAALLQALETTLTSKIHAWSLTTAEQILLVAFFPFVSSVRSTWVESQFEDAALSDAWHRELDALNPSLAFFSSELPEPAQRLLARAAIGRVVQTRRAGWSDADIRRCSPDVKLARWMAADPLVTTLVRATAASASDFASLPGKGRFRFEDCDFEVRWQLLACVIVLSELRVLSPRFLSQDALEHVAQLPDIAEVVENQFEGSPNT